MLLAKANILDFLRRLRGGLSVCLLVPLLVLPSITLRSAGFRSATETETTLEETEDAESLATTQQRRFQRRNRHAGRTNVGKLTLLPPESAHCHSCRSPIRLDDPVRPFAKRNESGSPLRC